MRRILVTGASGLLGLNFGLQLYQTHQIIGVDRRRLLTRFPFEMQHNDLTEENAIAHILDQVKPEIVVHCAALAHVDLCEENPKTAYSLNADMPAELAKECRKRRIKLIHISTDAVFDGLKGNYREDDEPNPIGVYAASKLAGEKSVLEANPEALVARVNFYGWSLDGNRSLGEFFFNHLQAGMKISGFKDVIFCPLEATILAELLMALAEKDCSGLYHVVSSECQSKYDFGCQLADRFGLDAGLINPVSINDGGLRAARSPDLRLDTTKLANTLGKPAPGQYECLERFFENYQKQIIHQLRD